MNYGESESSSQAYSGLRGTRFQPQAEEGTAEAGSALSAESRRVLADPMRFRGMAGADLLPGGRWGMGAGTDPLTENYGRSLFGRTGEELLPSGKYGMGSRTDPAVEQFGKYLFGTTSGSMAARGHLSPESQAGVVGSAITNALPSLIPSIQNWQRGQYEALTGPVERLIPGIQQWQRAQFGAPMNLNQYAINAALTPASFWNTALGAQSQAQAQAFNFGFLNNPISISAGGGGGGGG